jgi:hypothetical protein
MDKLLKLLQEKFAWWQGLKRDSRRERNWVRNQFEVMRNMKQQIVSVRAERH